MRLYRLLIPIFLCFFVVSLDAQDYGTATYFDDAFHGRRTSSGEKYDKTKLTAAYKKYDFGTILRVTRLDNKRSVQVRIIDKGPFIKGRLIEISRKAAERLDMIGESDVEVKVEMVKRGGEPEGENIEAGTDDDITVYEAPEPRVTTVPDPVETKTAPKSKPRTTTPAPKREPKQEATLAKPRVTATPAPKSKELDEDGILLRRGNFQTYDLYKVQILRPQRKGYGVQVAYISNYENVLKQVAELQEKWFKNILISVEKGKNGKPVYRIVLGPFPDKETATAYKKRLKAKKRISGFLVDLSELKY